MGKEQAQRGKASSDRSGNSKSGSQGKQGVKYSLKASQEEALKSRGIKGDNLLDCIDLADEIQAVGGEITPAAKVVLYHATSEQNAKIINATGKMFGKEPSLYFSTKKDGAILGYGDSVVRVEIPLEKLELNDIFDDEVHLTMETKPYRGVLVVH